MKKIGLIISIVFILAGNIFAQDISISISQNPATMNTNSTGTIQVDICNNAPQLINPLAQYKIRPLISVNPLITITGVTDLPTGWSICSNDGQNIRLSNGTDNNLQPGDCRTFYINVSSGTTTGGPVNISSTLAFAGGTAASACSNGSQTSGNDTQNDNSQTSVIVGSLPVRLVSFETMKENDVVNLAWATTEEMNSDHFEIQHSVDTKNWIVIGQVVSNGDRKVKQSYTFTHPSPTSGSNYYRLKMVDKDATFAYSRIRSVEFDGDLIEVYPNPVADAFFIRGWDFGKVGEISLINSSGTVVYKASHVPASGIDVKSLVNGIYLFRITKENGRVSTQKIVINK